MSRFLNHLFLNINNPRRKRKQKRAHEENGSRAQLRQKYARIMRMPLSFVPTVKQSLM